MDVSAILHVIVFVEMCEITKHLSLEPPPAGNTFFLHRQFLILTYNQVRKNN